MHGKNIADFIDPDIAEKLEALEREEDALEAEGFYASDEEEEVCVFWVALGFLTILEFSFVRIHIYT